MSLPQAKTRTPESIADFSIVLTDYIEDGDQEARQQGQYEVQVVYNDGEIKPLRGNLLPHLSGSPITPAQLSAWLDWLRAKAEEEILP